jgi:hypothetical protein
MVVNNTTVTETSKSMPCPPPAPKTGKLLSTEIISRRLREQRNKSIAYSVVILCRDSIDQNPQGLSFYDTVTWNFNLEHV